MANVIKTRPYPQWEKIIMKGVFGGTFDPIHNGHLAIARQAQEKCQLSHVIFIPCHIPALRGQPQSSSKDRLKMVELAIQDKMNFIADDREIKRDGTSYMIDTLTSLQQQTPHEKFALIIGYDAWQHFPKWHHYQLILEQFELIIIHRPGYSLEHQALLKKHQHTIRIMPQPAFEISATNIRQLIKKQAHNITQQLPPAVWDYIQQQKLYQP